MMRITQSETHEEVIFVREAALGLNAIIAIHDTTLGPAVGGSRYFQYETEDDALNDALRLSKGMTYKNALAGLELGGGKSVILGPIDPVKREEAFIVFGKALEKLNGRYVTAEDVGVNVNDIQNIAKSTNYVTGLGDRGLGFGGDPAPYTALGVLSGLEATAQYVFSGRTDLEGLKVAVQGVGNVGSLLCKYLHDRGAKTIISDTDKKQLEKMADLYGAAIAPLDEILLSDVDIIAPCAMGHAITEDIATKMRAKAIAGAANNQLTSNRVGEILHKRRIAYAPDYAINAGGIIMCGAEYLNYSDKESVNRKVCGIFETITLILETAKQSNTPSYKVADQMAEEIISAN